MNVQVTEVNQPPHLDPIADQAVDEGTLLALQFTAEDPDFPPNRLVFTLAPGAPEGAMLTEDGAFTWTPDESSGGTSVVLTVRVSDLGSPEYTDSVEFQDHHPRGPNPPEMPFIPPSSLTRGMRSASGSTRRTRTRRRVRSSSRSKRGRPGRALNRPRASSPGSRARSSAPRTRSSSCAPPS